MTTGLLHCLAGLGLAAIALAAGPAAWAQAPSQQGPKTPVPPPPFATPPTRSEAGVRWQSLTPTQRQALAPLEREWPGIDAQRKQKWLQIAERYPSLPPEERTRITERMNEWARLTPTERGELRLRYQEAQQVPAPARSAKWEEYQNLPPDAKKELAARAWAAGWSGSRIRASPRSWACPTAGAPAAWPGG